MSWIAKEGEIFQGIINVGEKDLSNYLIIGKDKIFLIDSNMSFINRLLIDNLIKNIPNGRSLDGVLLTHSHFDHVGCIPYLRKNYPDLLVYGHSYAEEILKRKNARNLIYMLNSDAAQKYSKHELHQRDIEFDEDMFYVDRVIKGDEQINLGNETITVIETPGHTRCSMAFYLAEREALFPGEAVGAFICPGYVCPEFLSDYDSYMSSLKKCKELKPRILFMPHFGVLTGDEVDNYWDWAQEGAERGRTVIADMLEKECTEQEIIDEFKKQFFNGKLLEFQPEEAFEINVKSAIKLIRKQFPVEQV